MFRIRATLLLSVSLELLAGCVEMPTGPSVAVMPAPYKPFEVFAADASVCRQFAQQQIGQAPATAQNQTAGAVIGGTAVGAAAGALIGQSGGGAATGAGIGLLAGSAIGAGEADRSTRGLQRRYDIAYEQCMYSKGNQVPGYVYQAQPPPPRSR
ncbi:glycine zipper family protein [Nevskia soli]|uniref:glycine zipper family protein n=1 Tax=Nevskia soli TaxID=418856 RepID=UPI000564194C|nr:glycine zipper family protein [Nevskia soli]